jgi:hypothetical protein
MRTIDSFLRRVAALSARPWNPALPIAILAVMVACMMALYQRVEAPGADPSVYAGLAANLLAGKGYQFNFEPHTLYPPGLPFLFTLVGFVFGVGYKVRMMTIGVCAFLGLVAAYLVLRRRAGEGAALGITLLLASSAYFFTSVRSVPMSDIPYFAFSFFCLYQADRLWFDALSPRVRAFLIVGLSLCLPFAVFTRTAGVALLPAILVFMAARRLKRGVGGGKRTLSLLFPVGVAAAALGLWFHWSGTHRAPKYEGEFNDQYVAQLLMKDFHRPAAGKAAVADLAQRLVASCGCAGAAATELSVSSGWVAPYFWNPLVTIPCLLVLIGLVQAMRQTGGDGCDWYLVFSLLILLPWWFCDDGQRFLLPIFPLVALQAFRGARWLLQLFREKPGRFARFVTALGAVAVFVSMAAVLLTRGTRPGKQVLLAILFWLALALGGTLLMFLVPRRRTEVQPDSSGRPWSVAAVLLFALFIAGSFLAHAVSAAKAMHPDLRHLRHYPSILASRWIEDHTPPDAVIMAEQTAILHRLTGRRLVPIPATADPRLVASIVRERHIGILVVEERKGFRQPDSRALLAVLQQSKSYRLDLLARGQDYAIYGLAAQ